MKMIASTKLNRAQKSMELGRYYGQTTQGTHPHRMAATVTRPARPFIHPSRLPHSIPHPS